MQNRHMKMHNNKGKEEKHYECVPATVACDNAEELLASTSFLWWPSKWVVSPGSGFHQAMMSPPVESHQLKGWFALVSWLLQTGHVVTRMLQKNSTATIVPPRECCKRKKQLIVVLATTIKCTVKKSIDLFLFLRLKWLRKHQRS